MTDGYKIELRLAGGVTEDEVILHYIRHRFRYFDCFVHYF